MLKDDLYLTGTPTSVMYRRDVLDERGPRFFDGISFSDDTDAALELMRSAPVAFVDAVLCGFRDRDESIGRTLARNGSKFLYRFWLLEKYGPEFLPADEFAPLRERARRQYFWLLAYGLRSFRGAEFWRIHARVLRGLRHPTPVRDTAAALWASVRRAGRRAFGHDVAADDPF